MQDRFAEKYLDLTPYQYGVNNPVLYIDINGDTTFVDRSGNIIGDPQRDKKGNLVDNFIYIQNDDGGYDSFGEFGDENLDVSEIMENMLAENSEEAKSITNLLEFYNAVKPGSDWDLKNNENTLFGLAWKEARETTFSFGDYTNMTAADVGNYHFGYVGKFTKGGEGYSKWTLSKGAGVAEAIKEWGEGSKFRAILRANMALAPLNMRSGDRRIDYKWISTGIMDANRKKRK